ncbi:MAG TPA: ArsA-related P-loop ATPase [Bdellovibrionales bacterium]|nr:ArsA-related P-loop ATPase [Bdellovibrionales bacterium]
MQGKGGLAWYQRPIIFVSGKGGVGKSLVAAGIAKNLASQGRKVLLAELGEISYYRDFWGLPAVGHEPIRHKDGFDLALWSGETCLREYVLHYLRIERIVNLFFENKVMKALIGVAPGLAEIALVGKITSGLRKVGPPLSYDSIVVDCYATGHAEALFMSPKGMREAIGVGPMGHHSREMDEILRNENLSAFCIVSLLEELPVTETLEFAKNLRSQLGVHPRIVANKVLEMPVSEAELSRLHENEARNPLREFTDYLVGVDRRQKRYLELLKTIDDELNRVPMIFESDPQKLVSQTGESLRLR